MAGHHNVYVVYLRDPKGDGKAGYYVGMTGLSPEERFENHKKGYKSARVVTRCGERLVPRLYQHLNPMPFARAVDMGYGIANFYLTGFLYPGYNIAYVPGFNNIPWRLF